MFAVCQRIPCYEVIAEVKLLISAKGAILAVIQMYPKRLICSYAHVAR